MTQVFILGFLLYYYKIVNKEHIKKSPIGLMIAILTNPLQCPPNLSALPGNRIHKNQKLLQVIKIHYNVLLQIEKNSKPASRNLSEIVF